MSWFTEIGSDRIELLDGSFVLLRDGVKVDALDASRVEAAAPTVVLTFASAGVSLALSWGEWTSIEGLPERVVASEVSAAPVAAEEAKAPEVVAEEVVPKKVTRRR